MCLLRRTGCLTCSTGIYTVHLANPMGETLGRQPHQSHPTARLAVAWTCSQATVEEFRNSKKVERCGGPPPHESFAIRQAGRGQLRRKSGANSVRFLVRLSGPFRVSSLECRSNSAGRDLPEVSPPVAAVTISNFLLMVPSLTLRTRKRNYNHAPSPC